jgi:dolichyl-phosphate beta-glucosyltransferase
MAELADARAAALSGTTPISVIIPAYNEVGRLRPTLETTVSYLRGRGAPFEVIVVDDGSADETSALVRGFEQEAPEVRLIRLPLNRGKGFAVRTGIVNARGERILFADADGATPIGELPRLERALDEGAGVAIGSRALGLGEVHVEARAHRRLMGRLFHLLVSVLAVRGFKDTQCGFKLFTAEAAHDLFPRMRMNGFSFDVEILVMARKLGYPVREVPVNWTHQPGSRINLVTDSVRMAFDLFVIRVRQLRGDYDTLRIARAARAREALPLS